MWIRSQDKETIMQANSFIIDVNTYGRYLIKVNNNIVVGTYTSREEAIKVLDKVQKFYGINGIFQMP